MADKKDYPIIFGSGDLYIVPDDVDLEAISNYASSADLGIATTSSEIEDKLIKVGESNGEATLTIENEFVDVKGGANNSTLASFRTEENITFNAGIVTFDLEMMSKFLAAKYTENEEEGFRRMELGGNYTIPVNRLRFVHTKKHDGKKLILDMHKAMNKAGLEMAFNGEEATAFEFEFTLQKAADKENIVTITEYI